MEGHLDPPEGRWSGLKCLGHQGVGMLQQRPEQELGAGARQQRARGQAQSGSWRGKEGIARGGAVAKEPSMDKRRCDRKGRETNGIISINAERTD